MERRKPRNKENLKITLFWDCRMKARVEALVADKAI